MGCSLIVFLMTGGRGRAMVFSYQSIPFGACAAYFIQWLIDFCNKYVSSLWLMLSPWIIRTLTLQPLLASLVPHNFRRYHKPTIYLPQNRHHTYLLWHFRSHSEIYCHATFHRSVYYDMPHHCHIALHDHVVEIVFVAKLLFIIFHTCHSHIPVHRWRHSHRVIFCSKYWVISK